MATLQTPTRPRRLGSLLSTRERARLLTDRRLRLVGRCPLCHRPLDNRTIVVKGDRFVFCEEHLQ